MIELAELNIILTAAPQPATADVLAVVVDARAERVDAYMVLRRPWAAGGLQLMRMAERWSGASLRGVAEQHATALVAVVDERASDAVLDELAAGSSIFVKQHPDGHMTCAGRRLEWDPRDSVDLSRTTTVVLGARDTQRRACVDLPVEFEVSLAGDNSTRHVVRLEVESEHAHALPEPAWFRIRGPASGVLSINIEATPTGDRWALHYAGEAHNLRAIAAPRKPSTRGLLQRLAVIVDRTCPDRRGWREAYNLATEGGLGKRDDSATSPVWDGATQPAAAPTLARPYAEFNSEIRSALGQSLAGTLDPNVVVEAWGVADVAGNGVSELDGVPLPADAVCDFGHRVGPAVADLFAQCTYSPGLDLWDPIEEGLQQAIDRSSEGPARRSAVLIVGNSPPTVPNRDGPLSELLRYPGYPTSFRRRSSAWHIALALCEELDIPVIYLFLDHPLGPAETGQVSQQYAQATDLSSRVARALGAGVSLVHANADAEGLAEGVREAVARILDMLAQVSSVEVRP
jgi:hypothetical protein